MNVTSRRATSRSPHERGGMRGPVSHVATRVRGAFIALLAVVAGGVLLASPAGAQLWGDPFFRPRPPRAIPQQQNPFGGFFQQQPLWQPPRPPRPSRAQMGDFSKAPPPRKVETPPTTTVVVMGDAMADWLGYGLEEAYADNPEFGVVRKIRSNSSLIRNEQRNDSYDWVQSARDLLAQEKPSFVVMLIGLSDRVSIHERPRPAAKPGQQPEKPNVPGQPAQQKPQAQQAQQKPQGQQTQQKSQSQEGEQAQQGQEAAAAQDAEGPTKPEQAAPAEPSGPVTAATHEFRSDRWGELYAKRIDDTIAALKSKGVPVLWVGLPPIRGPRSRTDLAYLNDLYRARATKAGITYVDVWDGFVDEDGNYSIRGPDYNGQIRQLRSADGVYFTKSGAVKLGHYVEREIERLITARATPVALPAPEPQQPAPSSKPGVPAPRPVAGPVIPLTGNSSASEELAGSAPRSASTDPVAARVLVRGDPAPAPVGRADDFSWPHADADDTAIIPAAVNPTPPAAAPRPSKKGPAPAQKAAPKRQGQAASNASPPAPARR